jgi:hypothetical protein
MEQIDYITIQTPANASDFGDGAVNSFYAQAVTDGIIAEVTGYNSGASGNGWKQRITIQTLGSAVERTTSEIDNGGPAFTVARQYAGGAAGG